ncbi:MAG: MiaB/RimO family radical SAM methylthiotransferase [Gemmatimonadaceae bacterium]
MPPRVYLRTFGCRANHYDSEVVRALVASGGGELVDSPESATVALFNSCAVTAEAEADLRKSVRRVARANSALRSVVMGCAAARDDGTIAALPTVEHVIPGADFTAIGAALRLSPSPRTRTSSSPPAQSGTRALLRIQDGCDEHCTFCATTLARGANRSRPPEELLGEAAALAQRHPEIVLTGVHIGTYGRDIDSSLGALVERLLDLVPNTRLRLSSIEATELDDRLHDLFCSVPPSRLAPHLHAPLQSGSDRLLKRMGRHWYTAATYARAVERLVHGRPVFALGADVIAGFPGESEADHRATCAMIEALPFTYLHVFPYSARDGTAALRLPGHVSGDVVRERAAELRSLARAKQDSYRLQRLGGGADVVVVREPRNGAGTGSERESRSREGLTEDYLAVRLPAALQLPRGARFAATLERFGDDIVAVPVTRDA